MRKGVAIILLVMLAIGSFSFLPLAGADTQFQSLWIRMRGIITRWGETPAFGWLDAHARIINDNGTIHKWAGAHALWSTEPPKLNCTKMPKENVTFTFYTAKLVKDSDVKLNQSGAILEISGLWNVVNVTTTILVTENGELINVTRTWTPWIVEAPGVLRVLPPSPPLPMAFTLDIKGIPLLRGFVLKYDVRFVAIKICDFNDDGKVDLIDLVRVAKRYRAVPGLPSYVHELDVNFDEVIDVGDLTTVAANIEG